MIRLFRSLSLLALIFGLGLSHAEGTPLPWPFPWARQCPVNWKAMQGRYALSENTYGDHSALKIAIVSQRGFRMIRVSRYDQEGNLAYDGYTILNDGQRSVRLFLEPVNNPIEAHLLATIKLHFGSQQEAVCKPQSLVPILTLERASAKKHRTLHYKLTRRM